MKTEAGTTAVVEQEQTHAHRWRIDEAQGPKSRGVCKICGEERYFKNWLEDSDFITNEEHRQAA